MKTLYSYDHYKPYLYDLVSAEDAPRGLRAQMAKAIGCQAAYFSQVLNGKAELTEDQAIKLSRFLQFNRLESDYFLILIRLARATTPELRTYLEEERGHLKSRHADLRNRVDSKPMQDNLELVTRYFGSSLPSTIHMSTASPTYRTAAAIAKRFQLDLATVQDCLHWLSEIGYVVKSKQGQYEFAGPSVYLPKDSPINAAYQIHRRMQAVRAIDRGSDKGLHFSSVFTLDRQTLLEVEELLKKAIEKSHKKIHAGGCDELYGMCVDLFEVV
jgi:uncharacterized protein (TIGR02147 family)